MGLAGSLSVAAIPALSLNVHTIAVSIVNRVSMCLMNDGKGMAMSWEPGSAVLSVCNPTRDFQPGHSPSCVSEDSQSGEGFWVCLDRGCSSSPTSRMRRCG